MPAPALEQDLRFVQRVEDLAIEKLVPQSPVEGLVVINPQRDLIETIELPGHPFFVGVQYHPEFKSRPLDSHPIFRGFVAAALAQARGGGDGAATRARQRSLA